MLQRQPGMRLCVRDRANDGVLIVAPAAKADACVLAYHRAPAIGTDDDLRPDLRAIRQGRRDGVLGAVDRRYGRRRQMGYGLQIVERGELCQTDQPVFDDMAKRRAIGFRGHLAMVEMQKQRLAVVRDPDVQDGLGIWQQGPPKAGAIQHLL